MAELILKLNLRARSAKMLVLAVKTSHNAEKGGIYLSIGSKQSVLWRHEQAGSCRTVALEHRALEHIWLYC